MVSSRYLSRAFLLWSILCLSATSTTSLALTMSSSNSNSKPQQVCIVGAGPAGLYLAHLLLQLDNKIQINVLEKAPQAGTADANAFGFGVGPRHQRCLEHIPGLWSRIQPHSAPATGGPKVRIIGRNVLCRESCGTVWWISTVPSDVRSPTTRVARQWISTIIL